MHVFYLIPPPPPRWRRWARYTARNFASNEIYPAERASGRAREGEVAGFFFTGPGMPAVAYIARLSPRSHGSESISRPGTLSGRDSLANYVLQMVSSAWVMAIRGHADKTGFSSSSPIARDRVATCLFIDKHSGHSAIATSNNTNSSKMISFETASGADCHSNRRASGFSRRAPSSIAFRVYLIWTLTLSAVL